MDGQTISHYRILEELGGGGMGIVYKALDLRLNRFVALKFLSPELTKDHEANQRFRQEAQAASALDHPNICTIHEIDETPSGELFLTMAYYEGVTLRSRIAGGPLGVLEAMDLAAQAAQGLARAHQSGIVHRDVKPANLIVGPRNQFSVVGSIVTTPEAADVYIQPYGSADDQWEHLGRTPLKDVRLARGVFRIRIEKQSLFVKRSRGSIATWVRSARRSRQPDNRSAQLFPSSPLLLDSVMRLSAAPIWSGPYPITWRRRP